MTDLLAASSRVALAALLHDLGKFAERARIAESRPDNDIQQYCPFSHRLGRHTRIHAAYTALALGQLLPDLPLTGADWFPFDAPGQGDQTLINAAARHHNPSGNSFLEWVIAAADRAASGFERQKFEQYNLGDAAPTHYSARLWPLLSRVKTAPGAILSVPSQRLPLLPLTAEGIFPGDCPEPVNASAAQAEYRQLWDQFIAALRRGIGAWHDSSAGLEARQNLALWLDAFDSLLACYWTCIPSATHGVEPQVSLYDHSRATAAIAVALWRWHHDRQDDPRAVARSLSAGGGAEEEKFLLIQAETSGIQDFIFAAGDGVQKNAAKLLRGRSAYISLITECAALGLLRRLSLPPSSQVINAAGKFLILAPNTPAAVDHLRAWQNELRAWLLRHAFGRLRIQLTWRPARLADFSRDRFPALQKSLFRDLAAAKSRPLDLCGENPPSPVFDILSDFKNDLGLCQLDGQSPATHQWDGLPVCDLDRDQIRLGQWLAHDGGHKSIVLGVDGRLGSSDQLSLAIFGFHIGLLDQPEASPLWLRQWDVGIVPDAAQPIFRGLASRPLQAHVPVFQPPDKASVKYGHLGMEEAIAHGDIKSFHHLACEDLNVAPEGNLEGVAQLAMLKGDVDNLGLVFQHNSRSFSELAAISRQMAQFFTLYLPALCRRDFPHAYILFAGGDDFILLGPWHSQLRLALRLRWEFARFVSDNPDLHFSAAVVLARPHTPIRHIAHRAEDELLRAKAAGKDRLACFGQIVAWSQAPDLLEAIPARLAGLRRKYNLSTGYIYGLLRFCEQRADVETHPRCALWHALFFYRTSRWVTDRLAVEQRPAAIAELDQVLASQGIEIWKSLFRIPLSIVLYQHRHFSAQGAVSHAI